MEQNHSSIDALVYFFFLYFIDSEKPLLSTKNLRGRLNFCGKCKDWTPEQWIEVMVTDEVKIVQFSGTKQFMRRSPKARYLLKYTTTTVESSPSVMVWDCMSGKGRVSWWGMAKNTTIILLQK